MAQTDGHIFPSSDLSICYSPSEIDLELDETNLSIRHDTPSQRTAETQFPAIWFSCLTVALGGTITVSEYKAFTPSRGHNNSVVLYYSFIDNVNDYIRGDSRGFNFRLFRGKAFSANL